MTTVACVFVRGHVPYSWTYVTKLRSMVDRYLTDRPFRFVCLTDRPWECPAGIASIPIPPARGKAWWSKINLFDRTLDLGDRVLYLDLDSLVVGDLAPILDYPATFALAPHAGTFKGSGGLVTVPKFNSSVMVWARDVPAKLYDTFTPDVMGRLWGDQDWIGEQSARASTMPREWFPRLSEITGDRIPKAAKVVLCKTPKNEAAAAARPWFAERWT